MVHKFSLNGYNLALDVHSGAVHVMDRLSYELLDHLEHSGEDCPPGALAALAPRYGGQQVFVDVLV
mgnify:CR=1 FL=1